MIKEGHTENGENTKQKHVRSLTMESDHTVSVEIEKMILNMIEENNKIYQKQLNMVVEGLKKCNGN